MFVDETGLYPIPSVIRTYAPRGQTPVLQGLVTRDHLSVIGAITSDGRFLQLVREKSFNSAGIVTFLEHLQRHIDGPITVIWDGAPIHRSKVVKEWLGEQEPDAIELVRLPGYAPDLNPVEWIWAYLKQRLGNLCCFDLDELREFFRQQTERLRRLPEVLQAFWSHAGYQL